MFDEEVQLTDQINFMEKITSNPLPAGTDVGDEISFTNTITSNVDDFKMFLWLEIAKKHNLDPQKDYEKIVQMAENQEVRKEIKDQLQKESRQTYRVKKVLNLAADSKPETHFNHDENFFERFNHLPNSGIAEVSLEELKNIDRAYIGGDLKSPAYENTRENHLYGDQESKPTYLSTDYETAMSHMANESEDSTPILVEVSIDELLKYRKLLRDPESLSVEAESGKTFISFYGIPTTAINKILVLEEIG